MVGMAEKVTDFKKPPLKDEPMSRHTSMKVGGPADFLIYPQSIEELSRVLKLTQKRRYPLCFGPGYQLACQGWWDKGNSS